MILLPALIPIIIITAVVSAAATILVIKIFFMGKKPIEEQKPTTKNTIILGIRNNATDFAGLYEYTYAISAGDTRKAKNVFEQWTTTIADGEYDDAFKKAYEEKFGKVNKLKEKKKGKFKKAAKKLVKYIFMAGIIRSNAEFETADELTAEKYDMPGETSLETGNEYEVLAPYWYNKNEEDMVLVKGVIR